MLDDLESQFYGTTTRRGRDTSIERSLFNRFTIDDTPTLRSLVD
jgi:hypothetical protein